MAGWLKELKKHAIKLQRLAARDSLKSVGKLKRNSSTEKKKLCKKMKSDVLADNVGTFQKALSRSLSSLNSKKSKIHSVHLTILVQYAGLIQMSNKHGKVQSLLVWNCTKWINLNKDKNDYMKESALRGLCNTVGNLGRKH